MDIYRRNHLTCHHSHPRMKYSLHFVLFQRKEKHEGADSRHYASPGIIYRKYRKHRYLTYENKRNCQKQILSVQFRLLIIGKHIKPIYKIIYQRQQTYKAYQCGRDMMVKSKVCGKMKSDSIIWRLTKERYYSRVFKESTYRLTNHAARFFPSRIFTTNQEYCQCREPDCHRFPEPKIPQRKEEEQRNTPKHERLIYYYR